MGAGACVACSAMGEGGGDGRQRGARVLRAHKRRRREQGGAGCVARAVRVRGAAVPRGRRWGGAQGSCAHTRACGAVGGCREKSQRGGGGR